MGGYNGYILSALLVTFFVSTSILLSQSVQGIDRSLSVEEAAYYNSTTTSRLLSTEEEEKVEEYGSYPEAPCPMKDLHMIENMAVVYTWVNGSVPCYQRSRQAHGSRIGGSRDREIGELRASMRSLEKFMPWHKGPIYLVAPGHIPYWLNFSHPRIHVVDQDDLFPEYFKGYLPTFNTNVFELFLYRIPGLTDFYLQLNDDYIFTKPLYPHDFFGCNGEIKLLRERGKISHNPPDKNTRIWLASVLNTQQAMDAVWGKRDRYYLKHSPYVCSRKAFENVHQIFPKHIYDSLGNKFRSKPDMNPPLLHFYYLVHRGEQDLNTKVIFPPNEELSQYHLIKMKDDNMDTVQGLFDKILSNTHSFKMLTVNDEYSKVEVADMARRFFQEFLPEPSAYERDPSAPMNPYSNRDPFTCERDHSILPPVLSTPPTMEQKKRRVVTTTTDEVADSQVERNVRLLEIMGNGVGFGIGQGFGLLFVWVLYHALHRVKRGSTK